jgi:hypothetical protein
MKNTSENWNNFRIERVNETHYPAIVQLLNTTFGNVFSVDLLRKKYNTSFLGGVNIGFIAFDGSLAISHQMGLLTPLSHQGQNYLALQSCDSATHANFGKKGLWVALNDYVFRQAPLENIYGIFGMPNQNSLPAVINKLGYISTGVFKSYSIIVHKTPFWKIANRLKLGVWFARKAEMNLKKFQISPVSFSSFDENKHLIVHRSPTYLTYKIQKGSFFIKLHETIFWLKIRSGNLFIGDLKTPSEAHFKQAINELKSICFRSGLENIIFQSQEGSFEESLFAKNYDVLETMPVVFKPFNQEAPFHLLKCTYADLDTF